MLIHTPITFYFYDKWKVDHKEWLFIKEKLQVLFLNISKAKVWLSRNDFFSSRRFFQKINEPHHKWMISVIYLGLRVHQFQK